MMRRVGDDARSCQPSSSEVDTDLILCLPLSSLLFLALDEEEGSEEKGRWLQGSLQIPACAGVSLTWRIRANLICNKVALGWIKEDLKAWELQ